MGFLFNAKDLHHFNRWYKETQFMPPGIAYAFSPLGAYADSGDVVFNPNMGQAVCGYGGNRIYTDTLSGVNTTTRVLTVNQATLANRVVGAEIPHFDANLNCIGVLALTNTTSPFGYTVVSGSHPVNGGRLLSSRYDFSWLMVHVMWSTTEATKDTYTFADLETTRYIKMVRELNRIGWGVPKKIYLWPQTWWPNNTVHKDVPEWILTEITAAGGTPGVAYNNGGYDIGYVPNWNHALFIAAHGRWIEAMADYYRSDGIVAAVKFGSLGKWGEVHSTVSPVTFPDNTVASQYLAQYADNFDYCFINARRAISDAGSRGFGAFIDGFGSPTQVYQYEGGIYKLDNAATDNQGNYAQALTGWRDKIRFGEPYGSVANAENSMIFADEPTNRITGDVADWEQGAWSTTVGSAVTAVANTSMYRTKASQTVTGGSQYRVNMAGNHRCYYYQVNASNALQATGYIEANATITMAAGTTKCYFGITIITGGVMSATTWAFADPRLYLVTGVTDPDSTVLNVYVAERQIRAYGLSVYALWYYGWGYNFYDSRATVANMEKLLKIMGYRFWVSATTYDTDAESVTVTIKNDGCDRAHLGSNRYLKLALLNGSNVVVASVETTMRVDDIAGNGGMRVHTAVIPAYTTPGTYTLCAGVCPTGLDPDINLAMDALVGKWCSIGTVVIS